MDWIEITGATVDAAVEVALDSLGVHESELEYQVVEEPRRGFLGIGRVPARIRARVRPISREKPSDRRRRKRADQRRTRGGAARPAGAAGATATGGEATVGTNAGAGEPSAATAGPSSSRSSSRRRRRRSGGATASTVVASASEDDTASAEGDTAKAHRPPTDRSVGDERGAAASGASGRRSVRPSGRQPGRHETEEQDMSEATISVDEQLSEAREFTEGLIDAFGVDASVRGVLEDGDIQIDIEGDALGVLVGPKGATLSSIEELVRTAVLVRAGGFGARIHVDVAGYRRRRREALAGFATKLAEDVLSTGVAKALEPMSASDRKVVHDTVGEIAGVATTSEGDEPRRRVVIRPE
jgi:spoIIIJ-associated protein